MRIRRALLRAGLPAWAFLSTSAFAGVTNPDISLIGQLRSGWTDDPSSIDKNRPTLGLGETELAADAALNPYASGAFVFSFADGEAEVEEAYVKLDRALPLGLALKAGKYRAPFGKLNPTHPHALPFLDVPHLLEASSGLMPGEESYNEPALQISELFPGIGSWAPVLSLDIQQGSGFRTSQDVADSLPDFDAERNKTAPSWMAHLSNAFLVGDAVEGDWGFSFAQGTTNVQADRKAWLAGTDLKLKFELAPQSRLVWQSEAIWRHDDLDDRDRVGLVTFADWTIERWNAGALYEQLADQGMVVDRAVKAFAGFSLLEETTVFRLAVERRWLADKDPVHTVSAQLLFGMGPHKPHQF